MMTQNNLHKICLIHGNQLLLVEETANTSIDQRLEGREKDWSLERFNAQEMLKTQGKSMEGMTVSVSGSGNVAQYATEKATEFGAKVITLSDSGGYIVDKEGITEDGGDRPAGSNKTRLGKMATKLKSKKSALQPAENPSDPLKGILNCVSKINKVYKHHKWIIIL